MSSIAAHAGNIVINLTLPLKFSQTYRNSWCSKWIPCPLLTIPTSTNPVLKIYLKNLFPNKKLSDVEANRAVGTWKKWKIPLL